VTVPLLAPGFLIASLAFVEACWVADRILSAREVQSAASLAASLRCHVQGAVDERLLLLIAILADLQSIELEFGVALLGCVPLGRLVVPLVLRRVVLLHYKLLSEVAFPRFPHWVRRVVRH
jgi:hypothetical protein